MASSNNNRPRGWLKPVGVETEGDAISFTDKNGNKLLYTEREVSEVLKELVDNVIKEKDVDLYKTINTDLRKHIDTNIEILDIETKKYFYDKIDKIAEDSAMRMVDRVIEEKVNERVEEKLAEMRKLLNKKDEK